MGIPTFLRTVLGFPHPEKISSRGTPVSIRSSAVLGKLTASTNSLCHLAEGYSVRPSRPSRLPPHHTLLNAHQDGRPLRGQRAHYANGPSHALHR